jgi:ATP-dependent RNA helicase CshB
MHRIGRIGRYKSNGDAFVIYKNGIDSNINRLNKKGINFYYYQIKDDKLVSKPPLKLRLKQKLVFDNKTNNEIKKIIVTGSKKVVPNYKKKIKTKIAKIKQKLKHEYIEKKIKENLLKKNIERSKNR